MNADTIGGLFSDCQATPVTGRLKVVDDVHLGLRNVKFQCPELPSADDTES